MTTTPTSTESVWSLLGDDLRRFIRRRVADPHVAEDLLQETFLRIHRHLGDHRNPERLAAWVYRIARNVIYDHYRQMQAGGVSLAGIDPAADEKVGDHLRATAGQWLQALVRQMPDPYREAVQWSEIEGATQQVVAERLGLSLSGAKSRVQRGRALLRTMLERCCDLQIDQQGNLLDCDPKPGRSVCPQCGDMELPPPECGS